MDTIQINADHFDGTINNIETKPASSWKSFFIGVTWLTVFLLFLTISLNLPETRNGNATDSMAELSNRKPLAPSDAPKSSIFQEASPENFVCITHECVNLASELLEGIDPSVDPCEDFYEATCGRFKETKVTSEDMHVYHSMVRQTHLAGQELKNILADKKSKSTEEVFIKKFYAKCMRNDRQFRPYYNELMKLGKFPVIDDSWDDSDYNLTHTILAMARIMPEDLGFFKFGVYPFAKQLIAVMNYGTTMTAKYSTESLIKYFANISLQLANYTGSSLNESTLWKDIEDVLILDKLIFDSKENGSSYSTDLPEISGLDIEQLQRGLISQKMREEFNITEEFPFISGSVVYFKNLSEILNNTDSRVIQNYLMFRWIIKMSAYYPLSAFTPRSNLCFGILETLLPGTLGMVYVHRKIKPENVAAAKELVEEFKKTYIEEFMNNDWMDLETRKAAIEKVQQMRSYVGYPEHFTNGTKAKKFSDYFVISNSDAFFEVAVKMFNTYSDEFFTYHLRDQELGYMTEVFTTNAAYTPLDNSLAIAALFLRFPYFDVGFPSYFNVGGFGSIIAHEMGHGFDSSGSNYDKTGKPFDWWSAESREKYESKSECFVNQYGSYKLQGRKVNGILTVDENLADGIGFRVAYNTMKRLQNKTPKVLPGFQNYTTEQMFFYSFATLWCGIPPSPSIGVERLLKDVHSPNRFRVNGVVSNSKEFAKAFNCKPNSNMNPEKKCRIF